MRYQSIIDFKTFVRVTKGSTEYDQLQTKFCKDWSKAKGPCPNIVEIMKVVNPKLNQHFEIYVQTLPEEYRKVERYYHGTKLACNVTQFYEMCDKRDCGVCGVAKHGLNRCQNLFQRFGPGFHLAPHSSKSHDYSRSGHMNAVFLCDVAPGRKYSCSRELLNPPEGYHSVYGGDLNYPELVIYNERAINPCYVFVYC